MTKAWKKAISGISALILVVSTMVTIAPRMDTQAAGKSYAVTDLKPGDVLDAGDTLTKGTSFCLGNMVYHMYQSGTGETYGTDNYPDEPYEIRSHNGISKWKVLTAKPPTGNNWIVLRLVPVQEYKIQVETNGNGSAKADVEKAEEGEQVTLSATPDEGYEFIQWTVAGGGITIKENQFTMPAQEVTVYASFQLHVHTPAAEWQKNASQHWHNCTAGDDGKVDTADHTWNEGSVTTQPTHTKEGVKTYSCTVCGQTKTESLPVTVPAKKEYTYKFIKGANGEWKQNVDKNLSFTVDGDYKEFVCVKVDGKVVDASNYTTAEESTIIDLKAAYMKTLSVGKHTLEVVYTEKSASTEFAVKAAVKAAEKEAEKEAVKAVAKTVEKKSPKTGDNNNFLMLLMFFVSGGASAVYICFSCKKNRA